MHRESSYFVWIKLGKESIALDLKREHDLQLLRRMIARCIRDSSPAISAAMAHAGLDMRGMRPYRERVRLLDVDTRRHIDPASKLNPARSDTRAAPT